MKVSCTIKLMNGDELVGRVVATDEETNKDVVYIEDPLQVQTFTKEVEGDKAVCMVLPSGKTTLMRSSSFLVRMLG